MRGRSRQGRARNFDRRDQGLVVPTGLWNTVEFSRPDSVLVVLCDRAYEAHDYIRDYAEFLSFRRLRASMKIIVTGALGHVGSALMQPSIRFSRRNDRYRR